MSNQYHTRVFVLNYSNDSLPKFETAAEIDEYHRALGRMVAYGMAPSDEDTVTLVAAGITQNPLEVCAAYYYPLPAQRMENGERWYIGSASEVVGTLIDTLAEKSKALHRPFVMAAVKHNDGKFGFHS